MNTKIIGTGSYLPPDILTNDDIARFVETSDEWIAERTGIRRRHIASTDTTVSMATKSAFLALEDAGISAEEIDLIIVGTVSADELVPSTACRVQSEIGAKNAVSFDINAACSGFLFALSLADAYIKSGACKKALIIGVETLSKIVDWTDRGTCVLFGDGAGSAVLSTSDKDEGLLSFTLGSDGFKSDCLMCNGRSNENPLVHTGQGPGYISMDGPEVFKFAVKTVPGAIKKVLEEAGLEANDVDHFILHQANLRILQTISKRLKIPMDKIPTNMDECGNTSAASVPILLDQCARKSLFKSGDYIILAGFGAGLTWGCSLIKW